jgi:hypothetical protein
MPIIKSVVAIVCPECGNFVFNWWQDEFDENNKMCLSCWAIESLVKKGGGECQKTSSNSIRNLQKN